MTNTNRNIDNELIYTSLINYLDNRIINDNFNLNINIENDQIEEIINFTLNQESNYKYIISNEGKKELKKVIYDKKNNTYRNNSCPFLFIDFKDNEEVTCLPCNHIFDNESIYKWVTTEKAQCPLCRYQLHCNKIFKSPDANTEIQENNNFLDDDDDFDDLNDENELEIFLNLYNNSITSSNDLTNILNEEFTNLQNNTSSTNNQDINYETYNTNYTSNNHNHNHNNNQVTRSFNNLNITQSATNVNNITNNDSYINRMVNIRGNLMNNIYNLNNNTSRRNITLPQINNNTNNSTNNINVRSRNFMSQFF